ncbi:unnamed protein product [Gordionus sp. m RMFG-2023]
MSHKSINNPLSNIRAIYQSRCISTAKPKKTIITVCIFWLISILLISIPLSPNPSLPILSVYLFGDVLHYLGISNSVITYVSIFLLSAALTLTILLGMILWYILTHKKELKDGFFRAKKVLNKIEPHNNNTNNHYNINDAGPIINIKNSRGDANNIRVSDPANERGDSSKIPKNNLNKIDATSESSMVSIEILRANQDAGINIHNLQAKDKSALETMDLKILASLVYTSGLYLLLFLPYFIILIVLLLRVKGGNLRALYICEILTYYLFMSFYAFYPYIFLLTVKPLRHFLWKLVC